MTLVLLPSSTSTRFQLVVVAAVEAEVRRSQTAIPARSISKPDAARTRGDYGKAKELYGRVLAANPNDSEALAGLGDCLYAQRDLENAKTYYRRAIDANSTYTPALIGLADTLWDSGDHAAAQKMYKDMVDRLPESIIPARVKSRSGEGGGGGGPAPSATATDKGGGS